MRPSFSAGQIVRGRTGGTFRISRPPLTSGPYMVFALDPLTHRMLDGAPLYRYAESMHLTVEWVTDRAAA